MSVFRRTAPQAGPVTLTVDGRAVTAYPGDTVATAMLAAGYTGIGANVKTGAPSAPFCLIGICFGCQCSIDGAGDAQACLVPVRDGMVVETPRPLPREADTA
jgi:predicted molibdopterin-dependent oxidoreductase YjgC